MNCKLSVVPVAHAPTENYFRLHWTHGNRLDASAPFDVQSADSIATALEGFVRRITPQPAPDISDLIPPLKLG